MYLCQVSRIISKSLYIGPTAYRVTMFSSRASHPDRHGNEARMLFNQKGRRQGSIRASFRRQFLFALLIEKYRESKLKVYLLFRTFLKLSYDKVSELQKKATNSNDNVFQTKQNNPMFSLSILNKSTFYSKIYLLSGCQQSALLIQICRWVFFGRNLNRETIVVFHASHATFDDRSHLYLRNYLDFPFHCFFHTNEALAVVWKRWLKENWTPNSSFSYLKEHLK